MVPMTSMTGACRVPAWRVIYGPRNVMTLSGPPPTWICEIYPQVCARRTALSWQNNWPSFSNAPSGSIWTHSAPIPKDTVGTACRPVATWSGGSRWAKGNLISCCNACRVAMACGSGSSLPDLLPIYPPCMTSTATDLSVSNYPNICRRHRSWGWSYGNGYF